MILKALLSPKPPSAQPASLPPAAKPASVPPKPVVTRPKPASASSKPSNASSKPASQGGSTFHADTFKKATKQLLDISGTSLGNALKRQGPLLKPRIGVNYTDIGRAEYGMPSGQNEAELRAQVATDLDRLRQQGITDVRIWALGYNGTGDLASNPDFAALRVRIILEEAAARGMIVTVDFMDLQRTGSEDTQDLMRYDPETRTDIPIGAYLDKVMAKVLAEVGRSNSNPPINFQNVLWSLGNEPAGPNNPQAFAQWYGQHVATLRGLMPQGSRVVAELIPGSCASDTTAMEMLAASVDVISIHLYPDSLNPPLTPENADAHIEYQRLLAWKAAGRGKPVSIGEFSLAPSNDRGQRMQAWLERFERDGIIDVKLWQFLKNEPGHLDGHSLQLGTSDDILQSLLADGWLVPPS